jgi:hypothetical protein
VREGDGDRRVEEADARIELKEGQEEDSRRRHPVREEPEEEVLVAEERVAREGVRGGERHRDREDGVDGDVRH